MQLCCFLTASDGCRLSAALSNCADLPPDEFRQRLV